MPQNSPFEDRPLSRRLQNGRIEPNTESRLVAPRGAARIVARERLLARLLDARRSRCVILQGPAGCGKTSVVIAWREALLSLSFDIAWLTLAPEDNDLAHFFDCLVASLAHVDPAISREAGLLGGRGLDDEAVERTVIALVRGIAGHPGDVVLVLDDLHHLANARSHEALQWLLDYAPPNLHLVLVSRGSVPLSLGRTRDEGLVLELDMRDLRFTAAESEQFLREQLGEINPRDARYTHEQTDGWVAGLQLCAMRFKKRKPGAADIAGADLSTHGRLQDARGLTEYFEREVLSRLALPEVELLIRISACTLFCAPLCIALLGDEQTAGEVRVRLARLESDNLFIAPIESAGSETWYRLNPLFRETLLERFQARSEVHRRAVHRAAWTWFRDHDHPDEAVRHALLAGEAAAAADLVQRVARTMQVAGKLRKLVGLMRLLPCVEVQARIGLRLLMAHLHLYAREFGACAAAIARLHDDIPFADTQSRYRLALLRTALAVQRDDPDAAASMLPQLLGIPADADSLATGARTNLLSWIHMRHGAYEEARRVQTQSAQLLFEGAPLSGTPAGALNGRCMIGFSHALEGRFVQVERIARDVLCKADRLGSAAAEAACFAAALLAEALYEFGEPGAARKLLEERIDVLERVSIPDSVLRVFTVLSAVHWTTGHRLNAFAYLERLERYATQHGLVRLVAHAVAEQTRRHLSCGQFDAAQAGLTRLDTIAAHSDAAPSTTVAEIRAMAARGQIDWCMAHEDWESAALRLQSLIPFYEAHGWQRHVACLQMQSALVDERRGRPDAARVAVLAALRRGHRLGLIRSLLDTDPGALDLITHVEQSEPHDPVLSFYVDRLHAAQQGAPRSGAKPAARLNNAGGSIDTLSERETRVVGLLAHALPNKKIARTLGISPETVKWHLKNIYGKLGVASRDEAVARVRDLELSNATLGSAASGAG
ncbi:LuxR C-terminal-related transcriptional regulator [Caballeronia sp. GAWG2-1]|uniref:LuxR C-terminal-related transcriptional regulator n=1 Tax=Caballeronia sp. GAWG2-1 TaxID=2921744 RepID=UPI0020279AF3|nr:LuxR C-terminal-related transcriptional regulator [Caballeronia sp. GAWG2-1]